MRLLLLTAALLAIAASPGAAAPLALATTSAPAAAAAPKQPRTLAGAAIAVSGRGWGHGVGMSQWGAAGFAGNGFTYDRILAHYYPGTVLERAAVSRVRVLLVEGAGSLRVSSAQPFRVEDAAGAFTELPAGTQTFGTGFRINAGNGPKQLRGPLHFHAGGAPLQVGAKRYRGSVEVAAVGGKLRAINHVGLEGYLYGVVPDEMPPSWHTEALKAQAVVARSYALANRRSGAFDLYADVRSQVYNGFNAEDVRATVAVSATAGEVLTWEGRIASTFFFSTSGGRTESVADAWGGSSPIPYLVSVPDPYDSASPHHTWGPVPFTAAAVRKALGVKGELLDLRTTLTAAGRVKQLVAVGSRGQVTMSGSQARTALKLKSTWFRLGVLSLAKPLQPVTFGGRVQLAGVARNVAPVTLERRAPGGAWQLVGPVTPGPDGAIAVVVGPGAASDFRLASGALRTAPVRVAVAPRVRLVPPTEPTSLSGTVRPVLAGATVAIQRLDGTAWRPVAAARLDAQGNFTARLELVPGTYRARVAPVRGFVAGVSPVLVVVAS